MQEYEQVLGFVLQIPPLKHGIELHGLLSSFFLEIYSFIYLSINFLFIYNFDTVGHCKGTGIGIVAHHLLVDIDHHFDIVNYKLLWKLYSIID